MLDWPHQTRGVKEVTAAIQAGEKRIALTSPTGGGKSRIMTNMIWWAKANGMRTVVYTNRKMLLDQMARVMSSEGIYYGIRAASFRPDHTYEVQLASIQTELSRVYKNKVWEPCNAQLAIVDEAHNQTAEGAQQVLNDLVAAGGTVLGITATPIDIGHMYDRLIVAGTNSELRACGALVPCHTYGPDEPDAKRLADSKGKVKIGEDFTEAQVRKAIMTPTIFGRVFDWWQKLNPDQRPAILFGPGVKESMWFAEQFHGAGVKAAHIDGEHISFGEVDSAGNPVVYPSTKDLRAEVMRMSQTGEIRVLCNRFVLREGVDAPWLYHGIFATCFGSLTSYLQAGGRLLRAHSSLDSVVLQDHGGNWHRHGSLNADRQWDMNQSAYVTAALRAQRLREHKEPEPIVCPMCHAIRLQGKGCQKCGHIATSKSRMVVQTDGSLKAMTGDIYTPRVTKMRSDTERIWEACYNRARSKKWNATFAQAEALFFYENHYWPPRNLPCMPTRDGDWFRKVRAVPRDALIQYQPELAHGGDHDGR